MQHFYCSSCGKQNPPDAKFCNNCAVAITPPIGNQPIWQPPSQIPCPSCRMMNPATYKFCYLCHKPMFYNQPIQTPVEQSLSVPSKPGSFGYQVGKWWAKQSPKSRLVIMGIAFVGFLVFVSLLSRNQTNKRLGQERGSSAYSSIPAAPATAPSPSSRSRKISKQELGKDYPFTISEGFLSCADEPNAVLFVANAQIYAVNGTAKSLRNNSGDKRYKPIDEIWADDLNIKGAKINIGKVIEIGLEICKNR